MQLGILKPLDMDEKLIVSLRQTFYWILTERMCLVLFSATVMNQSPALSEYDNPACTRTSDKFVFQNVSLKFIGQCRGRPWGSVQNHFLSKHRSEVIRVTGGRPYLASSCVEPQRRQVWVKDHVTGLDVDGRLPLSDGTQVPGWVHQTPEGWDWRWEGWGWESGGEKKG